MEDGIEPEKSAGAAVAFFSLEMSADQLATRMLAEQSKISSEVLRMGKITQEEFRSLARASAKFQNLPFYIDDTPGLTIAAIRTRARRLKRQKGIGLIIVDYLQLLQGAGRSSNDNRVQEISEISRGLKTLAKELNVPVLALSQLSRAVEQRENKRPQLADLRESGSIEQDADIVMFIYREEYYLSFQKPTEATDGDDRQGRRRLPEMAGGHGQEIRPRRADHRQAAPRLDRHARPPFRGALHPLLRPRRPERWPRCAGSTARG